MRLTRYAMYENIKKVIPLPLQGHILGISGLENFLPLVDQSKSTVVVTAYPKYDIHDLPFENEAFDYVISDQVLEHVENPLLAFKEASRVLKRGGLPYTPHAL